MRLKIAQLQDLAIHKKLSIINNNNKKLKKAELADLILACMGISLEENASEDMCSDKGII